MVYKWLKMNRKRLTVLIGKSASEYLNHKFQKLTGCKFQVQFIILW